MQRVVVSGVVLLAAVLAIGLGVFQLRHRAGVERASEAFASYLPSRLGDFGETRTLRITPLVDYHTERGRPELVGEVGLSYLIETDEHRILFDVAHNAKGESPSPLEHNMRELGVELASIDTVFISHNHLDHVGGMQRQQEKSFSIGNEQLPLPHPEARAFVPIAMTYPGLAPIVGCGHQPIPNLLRRYDQLFDELLYGILGGLHLPVPQGRLWLAGLDVQRVFASGAGLFSSLTMAEIEEQIALLKARRLGLIGVGGHDSSDEVIALFADEFGEAYRYLRVGAPIVVAAGATP